MKKFTCIFIGISFVLSAFSQSATSSFVDTRDNTNYTTIEIGSQIWMAENLNYNSDRSWCYDNNISLCEKFGRLYSYDALANACPAGWQVPNDTDLEILINTLGGKDIAGSSLKDNMTSLWTTPNSGTTNSSKFSALPGGLMKKDGSFENLNKTASFWSLFDDGSNAWGRHLSYDRTNLNSFINPEHKAYSIRCIKK